MPGDPVTRAEFHEIAKEIRDLVGELRLNNEIVSDLKRIQIDQGKRLHQLELTTAERTPMYEDLQQVKGEIRSLIVKAIVTMIVSSGSGVGVVAYLLGGA